VLVPKPRPKTIAPVRKRQEAARARRLTGSRGPDNRQRTQSSRRGQRPNSRPAGSRGSRGR
jgi:hypothetical protein